MKAITIHSNLDDYGDLLHEVDQAGNNYEVDEAKLYLKDGRYTYLQASGCSCWEGDYEGWTDVVRGDLLRMAATWAKGWTREGYNNTESLMGKWILENV